MAEAASTERTVRLVHTEDEHRGFAECVYTGFLGSRQITDELLDFYRKFNAGETLWAAFDGDRLCGTTLHFPSTLHSPGGRLVPVACVSGVTVLPTHTRRGHFSRLMATQIEAAEADGAVASMLVAAEWPIYGRMGYGPATEWVEWEIDARAATVVGERVGSVEIMDATTLDPFAVEILDRHHERFVGTIERSDPRRQLATGAIRRPGQPETPTRTHVLHRDADGRPAGYAVYDPTEKWDGMRPNGSIEVVDLIAVDEAAERELWRYLLGIDLVSTITWHGSPASVLPYVLTDARAAKRAGTFDHQWVRLLDIPAALTARSYRTTDTLVIDVVDPLDRVSTRVRLAAGPDGSECIVTCDEPDVTVPLGALSAAWLGGTDLRLVAAAGGVAEHRTGAIARLATLLLWDEIPFCSTDF